MSVALDAAALADLSPFHVVWDTRLAALSWGPAAGRLVPGLAEGVGLPELFAVRRPHLSPGVPTVADLVAATRAQGGLVLLEALGGELTVKGQLLLADGGEHLLLVGSPVVRDLSEVTRHGLKIADFPVHDSVSDFLLALRSRETSLAEAQALAGQLAEVNRDLERRVEAAVAERQRMEADLRLAHKLEAVGQLASGIAHEINTPVQFVGDNLRFLADAFRDVETAMSAFGRLSDARDPQHALELLELARRAAADADVDFLMEEGPRAIRESLDGTERVTQIVRAMKEFAHTDSGEKRPVDLNRCIETTLVVARNEYRHCADLETDLAADLPPVPCIAGEINQVVLNLVVNAAHAIADRVRAEGGVGKGRIRVTTAVEDGRAVVTVADSGSGIPEHVRPRIFDPFFTTKEVGRGTGQGLSVCHSIVTGRHDGRISFTTVPGEGTTFRVELPLTP